MRQEEVKRNRGERAREIKETERVPAELPRNRKRQKGRRENKKGEAETERDTERLLDVR